MSETTTMEKPASAPKSLRLMKINSVQVSGHLTADPVLRPVGTKSKVAQFQVAMNGGYRDKQGTWQDQVSFVTVTAWNLLAEKCEKMARKGSPVYVEGRLRSDSWQKNGQTRYGLKIEALRIQFLEKSKGQGSSGEIGFGE